MSASSADGCSMSASSADGCSMSASSADRGSTSLTVVLLMPIVVVLMFAGFQAALWNHARAEARSVARDTAALVARQGVPADQAMATAQAALADAELHRARVSVQSAGGIVHVTISGDAPGILRGTSSAISVSADLPIEGWVPL